MNELAIIRFLVNTCPKCGGTGWCQGEAATNTTNPIINCPTCAELREILEKEDE